MNKKLIAIIPWLSLVVALIGGVPGIITVIDHFSKSKVDVSYNEKNSFIALMASDKKEEIGKKVIGFNEIKFVGGEAPSSIKNMQFFINVKSTWWFGKWVEGKRVDLYTNDFDRYKSCIVFGGSDKNIIITDWINFKEDSKDYYLENGKVIPSNVAFIFDDTIEDIKNSKKWKFVVTDFHNNKYSKIITSPVTSNFIISNNMSKQVLSNFYINNPKDIFELLKSDNSSYAHVDYKKIQMFLKSKYNHTEDWYDK